MPAVELKIDTKTSLKKRKKASIKRKINALELRRCLFQNNLKYKYDIKSFFWFYLIING